MNDRNAGILEHIIGYCNEIKDAIERFGSTLEALQSDVHYRNSVAMCILQIGELAGHFSDDFKELYSAVRGEAVCATRNLFKRQAIWFWGETESRGGLERDEIQEIVAGDCRRCVGISYCIERGV